jgi:hypothetical protein
MNLRAFFIFSIAILCLLSCTSSPVKPVKKTTVKPIIITEITKNSDYYLTQAKQNHLTNNDMYQRNDLLLQGAEASKSDFS